MDKDKSYHGGANLPPPAGKYSGFTQNNLPPLVPSSSSEHTHFGLGMQSDANRFSHDISRMTENPRKNVGHRRAHSEILTLPDDISFDSDLGVVGGFDGPSLSDDNEEDLMSYYLDMETFNSSSATSAFQLGESSANVSSLTSGNTSADDVSHGLEEKPRIRHQHSLSMDGSAGIKPEMFMSGSEDPSPAETKKAISNAKLAELALVDPKRAKRVWANRQSAARSKERKMRYIAELERKVQALQTEATTLISQLAVLHNDSLTLEAQNNELKLRLQSMDQRVHLQDALNDALKDEVQHMKVVIGPTVANGGQMMNNFTPQHQQYYDSNRAVQHLQQLQIHPQQFQQQQFQQQAGDLKSRGSTP